MASKIIIKLEQYRYTPLSSLNSIRLLELERSEGSVPLKCTVHEADLDNLPKYIALSYVWGNPSFTELIYVNGAVLRITASLCLALRHFGRHRPLKARDIFVWTDAICINQKDIQERNSQVRRMKDIFERSSLVWAWLGPERDNSSLAFQKIEEMTLHLNKYRERASSSNFEHDEFWTQARAALRSGNPIEKSDSVISYLLSPELGFAGGSRGLLDSDVHVALEALFNRDWWTRAWIVQEGLASVETMICCGDNSASRDQVCVFLDVLLMIFTRPEYQHYTTYCIPIKFFDFWKERKKRAHDMRFEEILDHFRHYKASDLRDKVYAPLGLALESTVRGFRIGYELPVEEVYRDVALHLLSTEQNVDWLRHCGKRPETTLDLPSWVPDWSFKPRFNRLPVHLVDVDGRKRSAYMAHGNLHLQIGPSIIHENEIFLSGALLDIIDDLKISGTRCSNTSSEESWCPQNRDVCYKPTGENEYEAYLHTLWADMTHEVTGEVHRGLPLEVSYVSTEKPFMDKIFDKLHKRALGANAEQHDTSHSKIFADSGYFLLLTNMKNVTTGRRFARTKQHNFMGLVPRNTEIGDWVCVFASCQVPLIIRSAGNGKWALIGGSYVHGLMDGEVERFIEEGKAKLEMIVLQ